MTLVLALGGWLGWIAHRAQVQRHAVAAIVRAGGAVGFDYQFVNGDPRQGGRPNGRPWAPGWMRKMLGEEYFREVVIVAFTRQPPDDDALMRLKDFKRLSSLYITGTTFGDGQMAYLGDLRQLREVYLGSTAVSDAGLDPLRRLTHLEYLGLGNTPVSAAGAAELRASLPNVRLITR